MAETKRDRRLFIRIIRRATEAEILCPCDGVYDEFLFGLSGCGAASWPLSFRVSGSRKGKPKGSRRGTLVILPGIWVKWEVRSGSGSPVILDSHHAAHVASACRRLLLSRAQPITARTECWRLSYAERSCNPRPRSQATHFPHSSSKTTSVPFGSPTKGTRLSAIDCWLASSRSAIRARAVAEQTSIEGKYTSARRRPEYTTS